MSVLLECVCVQVLCLILPELYQRHIITLFLTPLLVPATKNHRPSILCVPSGTTRAPSRHGTGSRPPSKLRTGLGAEPGPRCSANTCDEAQPPPWAPGTAGKASRSNNTTLTIKRGAGTTLSPHSGETAPLRAGRKLIAADSRGLRSLFPFCHTSRVYR